MWDDAFIGEIKLFAGTYAPSGYALCNGQLLPISQNQALFSILGTTYGGNGVNTFALPDLRGRAAIGAGAGMGLTPHYLGDEVGAEQAPLTTGIVVSNVQVTGATITNVMAVTNNQPQPSVPTVSPALAINYIICLYGIYPVRD